MNKSNILNVFIDNLSLKEITEKINTYINDKTQHYISTVNPEIILKTQRDEEYRSIINNSNIATADGFGVVLASIFLNNIICKRVTGVDLSNEILKLSNQKGYKIFLLGAKDDYSKIAKTKLELKYKDIKIVGATEGFKNIKQITEEENQHIIQEINNSGAQIIFVGYGAPFQEKWIYKNISKIPNVKLAIGIGGTIDFWAGKLPRAPKLMRKLGLEWAFRLFVEPYRINRILDAVLVFFIETIKWKIHLFKPMRQNVLGVILNKENKILLLKIKNSLNDWRFPQGGVEKNESQEEALIREIKEESGLEKLEILGKVKKTNSYFWPINWNNAQEYEKRYNKKFSGQEQTIFFLKQVSDEIPNLEEEHDGYRWVEKDDLAKWISITRKSSLEIILKEIDQYIK